MDIIAQHHRRHEAKLRLVPLKEPDERLEQPIHININPHKTLCMIHMGVPFNFSMDDLRDAWHVANPDEKRAIEEIALQQAASKELVA